MFKYTGHALYYRKLVTAYVTLWYIFICVREHDLQQSHLFTFLFAMSSIIIFAKEVARLREVSYSFDVECDAYKEYYSCTLKQKTGGEIIGSITLPFEVIEFQQISISNVSEYLSHSVKGHRFCLFSRPNSYMQYLRKACTFADCDHSALLLWCVSKNIFFILE